MSCTYKWEKNGSPKSLKPLLSILVFTAPQVIVAVVVKIINNHVID